MTARGRRAYATALSIAIVSCVVGLVTDGTSPLVLLALVNIAILLGHELGTGWRYGASINAALGLALLACSVGLVIEGTNPLPLLAVIFTAYGLGWIWLQRRADPQAR